MIHCLASAKPWLGKKCPRLGLKPCGGTRIFSISLVCSKKFKYWQINNMNLWWLEIFLSVWWKKFWNFFLAWNVLKRKEKPKNSRNSTFFSKIKFPPVLENTCKIFKSKIFTLVCCYFDGRGFHRGNLARQGICLGWQGTSFPLDPLAPCTNPKIDQSSILKKL